MLRFQAALLCASIHFMLNQATPLAPPRSSTTSVPNPTARLWIVAMILLGFALRLYRLGGESLWYDETVSVYLATSPLTDLIAHTARDIHPPAYYMLLHFWQLLANPSVAFGLEFLYGWPSLCLDLLVMVLTYAIANRCFGPTAARWALALAVFHPVQLWFAQEVRMYALGALCLMLTVWAVSPWLSATGKMEQSRDISMRNGLLYILAALLGLYTLYYFLFWLVILNVCMAIRLWRVGQAIRTWIVLQIIVVIGWIPWLPIFIRQAFTPPVPSWRVPWQNAQEIVSAATEAIAALWIGHIPPLATTWPWTLLILLVDLVLFVYAKSNHPQTKFLWLFLCFGPLLLLLAVSLVGPPIYHVRYITTYAPLFVLLVAALLTSIPRLLIAITFIFFAAISVLSLQQMWTSPLYAADDHRAAVATLADQWRPGDVILVNAGWAYTALSVYWPTELPTPQSTRPPAIAEMKRLTKIEPEDSTLSATNPIVIRTGSVGGDSNLGWGLPQSDFYAISPESTVEAMAQLATNHTRIWHYRLYDTVSDPTGVIRQWLSENTTLEYSLPIPGRDFLLLERYGTESSLAMPAMTERDINFPNAGLTLRGYYFAPTIAAGEMLYTNLLWETIETTNTPSPASVSLRLYDAAGQFLLQSDSPITLTPDGSTNQVLALPIPAGTTPATYTVAIVVYAPDTLLPYVAIAEDGSELPSPIPLGEVVIELPKGVN